MIVLFDSPNQWRHRTEMRFLGVETNIKHQDELQRFQTWPECISMVVWDQPNHRWGVNHFQRTHVKNSRIFSPMFYKTKGELPNRWRNLHIPTLDAGLHQGLEANLAHFCAKCCLVAQGGEPLVVNNMEKMVGRKIFTFTLYAHPSKNKTTFNTWNHLNHAIP